jgi:DNA repair protein RadC
MDLPEPHEQPRHLLPYLADLRTEPVETFGVIPLDTRLGLLGGFQPIAGGHLTHLAITPREVFARAVSLRAAAIVLAHNHPSGDPEPSPDDRTFTRLMVRAGLLLEIRILDHLIITRRAYFGLSEARLL